MFQQLVSLNHLNQLLTNLSPETLRVLSQEGQGLPNLAGRLNLGQVLKGQVVEVLSQGKFRVNFQGTQILAQSPSPVKPGQTISARVEQVQPETLLKLIHEGLSAPKNTGNAGGDRVVVRQRPENSRLPGKFLQKSDLKSLKLVSGQTVAGKVTQALGQKVAIAQVKGQSLLINNNEGPLLRPGDAVLLKVDRTIDGHRLTVVPDQTNPPKVSSSILKPYLSARQPLGEILGKLSQSLQNPALAGKNAIEPALLEKLQKTLDAVVPKVKGTPTGDQLQQSVERSGVNYESRVKQLLLSNRDAPEKSDLDNILKGLLIKSQKSIEARQGREARIPAGPGTGAGVTDLLHFVKSSVDTIELNQLVQHFSRQENLPTVLEIPGWVPDGKSLKIYLRKEGEGGGAGKQGEKEALSLAFLLDMTALGELRIDARFHQKDLAVRFGSESPAVVEFLKKQMPEIKSRLDDLGFHCEVSCHVQKKEAMKIEDPLDTVINASETRWVDIKT